MITYQELINRILFRDNVTITSPQYDAVKHLANNIVPKVTLERTHPDWTYRQMSRVSYYTGFDVAQNNTYCIRLWNDNSGHIVLDRQPANGGTNFTNAIQQYRTDVKTGKSVRLHWDATNNVFRYWYIATDNTLYSGTFSSDGMTHVSGPATVQTNVFDFAVLKTDGSAFPVYYTASNVNTAGTALYYLDATAAGFNIIANFPFPPDSFDAILLTPGDTNSKNTRHLIVLSMNTAPLYTYKQVSGNTPQKEAMWTGGLFAYINTPGGIVSRGQSFNLAGPYAIHAFDEFAVNSFNNRYGVRLTMINDDFTMFTPATVLLSCVGHDGESNNYTNPIYYSSVYTYASRNGKDWTQDKQHSATLLGNPTDMARPVILFSNSSVGGVLNMYGFGLWLSSPGCADFFNALLDTSQWDVSSSLIDFSMDWASDVRSANVTLDNADGRYNNTYLTDGSALTMRVYAQMKTVNWPIATLEVDTMSVQRKLPTQIIQVSARDRMAWLYDRSTCPDSRQFDNTVIGYDNFEDIAGKPNTGLAHIAAVEGSLKTGSSQLIIQPSFKETIGFSTFKSQMASGCVSAYFKGVSPLAGGANVGGPYGPLVSSTTAPTYAGVVFRAIDKDNLWMVRWNYWTSTLQLVVRLNAADTVKQTANPPDSTNFSNNFTNGTGVGLRVEFDLHKIAVFSSSNQSNKLWQHVATFSYVVSNALGTPSLLTGYVGVVACGYSDETANPGELNASQLVGVSV